MEKMTKARTSSEIKWNLIRVKPKRCENLFLSRIFLEKI